MVWLLPRAQKEPGSKSEHGSIYLSGNLYAKVAKWVFAKNVSALTGYQLTD